MTQDYEFKIKITGAEGRGGWHELFWLLKEVMQQHPNIDKFYDIFEPVEIKK